MIVELSHFMLILAFTLSFCAALISLIFPTSNVVLFSSSLCRFSTASLFISFVGLVTAFVSDEFSLFYVAANSNINTPILYKICAAWGGYNGSMMLFLLFVSLWKSFALLCDTECSELWLRKVILIIASLELGLFIFLIFFANPFLRSLPNFPHDGRGLNLALFDLMFAIHPLFILAGFAGLVVPYTQSLANLLSNAEDASRMQDMRQPILISWACLWFGIISGSWWAYNSIGWGGWWFWDPVQNISLIPIILTTALVHMLKYDFKNSLLNIFLSTAPFAVSLFGMVLIRSGIIMSVHGFAVDYASGIYLICVFLFNLAVLFSVYIFRLEKIQYFPRPKLFTREFFLTVAILTFVAVALSLIISSLFPLLYELIFSIRINLGAPFYNYNCHFFGFIVLLLLLMVSFSRWHNKVKTIPTYILGSLIAALIVVSAALISNKSLSLSFNISFFLCLWVLFVYLYKIILNLYAHVLYKKQIEENWAMLLGHAGAAAVALVILLVANFTSFAEITLMPEKENSVFGFNFIYDSNASFEGKNHISNKLNVSVVDDKDASLLSPEIRKVKFSNVIHSTIAVKRTLAYDLQMFVTKQLSESSWLLYISFIPYISLLWVGLLFIVLAIFIAIFMRKKND